MDITLEHSLKLVIELITFAFVIGLLTIMVFSSQVIAILERLL